MEPLYISEATIKAQEFGKLLREQGYDAEALNNIMYDLFVGYRTADRTKSRKDTALDSLWFAAGLRQAAEVKADEYIRTAKEAGATLDEIGKAMGISRQAVSQRLKYLS